MGRPARLEGLPLQVHLLPEPQDHQALQRVGPPAQGLHKAPHGRPGRRRDRIPALPLHGIKMFIFDDDLFTFDKNWLREFSEKYRSVTRIGLCLQRPCQDVRRGGGRLPEGGRVQDSQVRRRERKREDTPQRALPVHDERDIEAAFRAAHKFGLHTSAFVMIGLPGEEKEDVLETMRLLVEACSRGVSGGPSSSPLWARGPIEIAQEQRAPSTSRRWRTSTISPTRPAWTWART